MVFRLNDDLRFALRLLGKSPAVSLIDGLLLRPLPTLVAPEELVAVVGTDDREPARFRMLTWADYLDYSGHAEAVHPLAATVECDLTLTDRGPAERLAGLAVSGNYFETLRLAPARGRLLSRADEGAPVAVLGYDLWQRHFGAALAAAGAAITLNGKRLSVVGVAPRGFAGTD